MTTRLLWRRGFFSNTYNVFSDSQIIGKLFSKPFSKNVTGEIGSQKIIFKTKGFINQRTEIINALNGEVLGEISNYRWLSKATITITNKLVEFENKSFWGTRWNLVNSEGQEINYEGSITKGQIMSNIDDSLLQLCGLFVFNYFWQMKMLLIVLVNISILVNSFMLITR